LRGDVLRCLQGLLHLLRKSVDAHGLNYRASPHGQLADHPNRSEHSSTEKDD
jgi:hypothetical protein